MLNDAISATQDLLSRVQLNRLRRSHTSATQQEDIPQSPRFRVHGWRWHHLSIIRDLIRLENNASRKRVRLCNAQNAPHSEALRRQMKHAVQYIVRDNWALHNDVEHSLFLPWISNREAPQVRLDYIDVVHRERQRLEQHAHALETRITNWSAFNYEHAHQCESELHNIIITIQRLRRNANTLFKASEQLFVPRVKHLFSESEQLRFNSQVLKHISGKQARMSLVMFRDGVDMSEPVVALRDDLNDFERDVPAAIRRVGVPFWRSRFVGEKTRFLTEP